MGVYSHGQDMRQPRLKVVCTYGKGALEGDLVLPDALNGSIGDRRLAVLKNRVDVDGLPCDGGLPRCVSHRVSQTRHRRVSGSWRRTLAAAKMSLTATAISGPMPSPSIKLTV